MEVEDGGSGSGSLRTRSQLAPDWTTHESLILVNELCAVEGDCLNTLSSFQKWKIVVDNCNALDVNRGLNQCRRHWDSLLSDYNKIKQWNHSISKKNKKMNGCASSSSSSSYWSLDACARTQLRLPEDFDADLFKAIEDHDRAREGRCDTDPETDPDAEPDVEADLLINLIAPESGSKKRKRKGITDSKKSNKEKEKPERGIKIQKQIKTERCVSTSEEKLDFHPRHLREIVVGAADEMAEETTATATAAATPTTTNNNSNSKKLSQEDKEKILSQKLRDNAELINATLKGEDIDYKLVNLRNLDDVQVDIVRRQADDLVIYMTNIADALDQLYKLVQEEA